MVTSPRLIESVAIAIFAKAPVAGFAKTRLIPRLGPAGAAMLQARLIERAVSTVCNAGTGPVSLWCAPDPDHAVFRDLAGRFPVALHRQTGGDLGDRMSNAFHTLTRESPALLIGTDCVVLDASHLILSAEALRTGCDAVFLPVEDGGYILVGLRDCAPALFRDIPWSTRGVMAETRQRAASLGLRVVEPAILWDLDWPEDYDRAIALGAL
jgi:rSAM/selenodomain-associated transferase 1